MIFHFEVKISDMVNHAQNLFYFIIGVYSMSPTFRRTVRVRKHLCGRAWRSITELLILRMNARSFTKSLFIANYVETITCATYGNLRNVTFNVWKCFSRVQQLFMGDRLPGITLARNVLWK